MQSVWLPTIRAQIETHRKNASRGIELQAVAPYELGMPSGSATNSCLYPAYVRAEAYLSTQQGAVRSCRIPENSRPSRAIVELCDRRARPSWSGPRPRDAGRYPQGPKRHTKIFLRSGKTPTLISPF